MSRIIELSNFFSHGESRRFSLSQDMFLVTNLRIIEFLSSRGMSRMVAEVMRVELYRHDRGMSEMGSGETGGMNGWGGWTGRYFG